VANFQSGECQCIGQTHQSNVYPAFFASYQPKGFRYVTNTVAAICEFYRRGGIVLKRAFKSSAWPAATWNFPDQAVTDFHRDTGNPPSIPCSITPGGDFNPDKGGFLVLWELKLVIRFPPGSNISICSGGVTHGNLGIQPGESRSSFVQYMAGGLARHVAYGFKPERQMEKSARAYHARLALERWEEALNLFSTVESLIRDRALVFPALAT
jgi:hypothetical protein